MNFPTTLSEEDRLYRAPWFTVLACNVILYIIAQRIKDNGIVDISWGLVFLMPNLAILTINYNLNMRTYLVTSMITVWAIRMALSNGLRHNGEDWRYAEMRQNWMKKGKCFYYVAAFVFIYFTQTIFQCLMCCSSFYINAFSPDIKEYEILDYIGAGVWFIGFLIELVADLQLQIFRRNPINKGKLLTTGLWKFSRHPNYFGEALLWWGIYIIACTIKMGWITVFSPVILTFLLRFVSGVPLLENKYKERQDFKNYVKQTNCFILWIPSKVETVVEEFSLNSTRSLQMLKEIDLEREEVKSISSNEDEFVKKKPSVAIRPIIV
ncbi:membrane protein [Stylonychia lemnae]|uniref:Membrane protein n=1 Tax=Stylonychia lemnae TaxID=5949 RepID=A0A078AFG7_STYLE|nr:membrane protein [Stylonychia lemnae]|eukprot:CDW80930.1 membrane protein [Stylonychia lemnae]